mgnify:CR=1 FL=1
MIQVGIQSIGLMAPGLPGWSESLSCLRGESAYRPDELPPLKPEQLKPNERRRTTQTIKLALVTADDALRQVEKPAELLSVFACTEGDLDIINQICLALTRDDRPVSPTQFHNSVHNAPAGYWSIGTGYRQASSSIGGLFGSFGMGLLEAAVQCQSEGKPVLLVAYDLPAPDPINQLIGNGTHFATAMLLTPDLNTAEVMGRLKLRPVSGKQATTLTDPTLESLRVSLPAARALPLLHALARMEDVRIVMPYLPDRSLEVDVALC